MEAVVDEVMTTFGMMRSLTASQTAIIRADLISFLAKHAGHNEHDLTVAGLAYLRGKDAPPLRLSPSKRPVLP